MKPDSSLETCSIRSTDSGKEVKADILKRTDKSLRVALQGTDIVLNLTRTDVTRPYVGWRNGIEFISKG